MNKALLSVALSSLLLCLPALAQHHGGGGGIGGGGGRSAAPQASPRAETHAQAPARAEARSQGHPSAAAGHPGVSPGVSRYGYGRPGGYSGYGRSSGLPYRAGGGYNGYLGRAHSFVPWNGHPYFFRGGYGWGWNGYPLFWFGGLYWGFDLWPYGYPYYWGYSDPIYIEVDNGCYYAYDDLHPGQKAEVTPQPRESTGTVVIRGGVKGDQVMVDKALAGYIGELGTFSLPAGPHALEVKGKGPYLGEDIMVLAGHELDIDVPVPPSD
jgi:hypothetical protein